MKTQIGRWIVFIGALGFAALGQFYFVRRPEYFWDGVVFYGIAALLMLALLRERADLSDIGRDSVGAGRPGGLGSQAIGDQFVNSRRGRSGHAGATT